MGPIDPRKNFLLNGHCGLVAFNGKSGGGEKKQNEKRKVGFFLKFQGLIHLSGWKVYFVLLDWKMSNCFEKSTPRTLRVLGLELDMVTSA